MWAGPWTVLIQGKFEMLGARCTQFGGLVGGSIREGLLVCDQLTSDTEGRCVCVCVKQRERLRKKENSQM